MTADILLAAVRADPDADLPRLVYADHLDDAGQPERAEFIRVQCELARLPEWDDRRPPLEDREYELLDAHEADWLGDVSDTVSEWRWWRGFIHRLDLSDLLAPVAGLPDHAISEAGCGPTTAADPDDLANLCRGWLGDVRSLDLGSASWAGMPEFAPLFTDGLLPQLSALIVSRAGWWSESYERIAASPAGRRLVSLQVDDTELSGGDCARLFGDAPLTQLGLSDDVTGYGLERLLGCPFAARLIALDLAFNPLEQEDWRAFGRLPADAALERLIIAGTDLARFGLDRLLALPGMGRLTDLDVSEGGGWSRRYESLAASDFWTRAERVRLHQCEMSADALRPLCRAVGPTGLRLLDLGHNDLTGAGVLHLIDARWGESLDWLALNGNRIDDDGVAALMESGRFPRLRTLHLGHNHFTHTAAVALAGSAHLSELRLLTLSSTRIARRSVAYLLNADHWQLFGLGVSACDLEPGVVLDLAASPRLRRLQWLDLSDNPDFGGDALLPLAESPHLSRLCELDIGRIDVSDRVCAALRERLGRRLSD